MPSDADARGNGGGRAAGGDAGAPEAKGKLLVDWICDVFQLVCRGKGGSSLLQESNEADGVSVNRNGGPSWVGHLFGFSCYGADLDVPIAMYVLPRGLESAWSSARKRAWVPIVPFGETILGMVAMGLVMDNYKHSPSAMSGLLRRVIFQVCGPA